MRTERNCMLLSVLLVALVVPTATALEDGNKERCVLFANVRIFNGVDSTLRSGHVLIEGNSITKIASKPINPPAGTVVISPRHGPPA